MFKKISCMILALILCASVFVSCGDQLHNEEPITVKLNADGLKEYTIVYSAEDGNAGKEAAEKIKEAVNSVLSITLEVKEATDSAEEKVISVITEDNTTLPGAKEYLRVKDFALTTYNGNVTITAGSDEALAASTDYFISLVSAADATELQNGIVVVEGEYPNGYVTIDGIDIERYDIVYPEGCDLLTYYTAVALSDYLVDVYDITLDVKADSEAETVYEILIGYTNRILDVDPLIELGENQYVLCKDEGKVVIYGNSYMIAGGASALINQYMASASADNDVDIATLPTTVQASTFQWLEPASIIYMIGDGMGPKHIEAAKELRDMPVFFAEEFPYSTKVKTYSYSVDPLKQADATDSAAAGTALATGYKTINAYLGLDHEENPIQNLRELADSLGAKNAIITTDSITGATPSAFLCHHNDRTDGEILQNQIDALYANGEIEYYAGEGDDDTFIDTVREALSIISKDGEKFFIMIEEAQIDKKSHNQDLSTMPDKVVRFNQEIAYCAAFAVMHPDTIVLVTADHETGSLKKTNGIWNFNASYHSNSVVPLFALGYDGLEELMGEKSSIDNTSIAKFIAKALYGVEDFGDQDFNK